MATQDEFNMLVKLNAMKKEEKAKMVKIEKVMSKGITSDADGNNLPTALEKSIKAMDNLNIEMACVEEKLKGSQEILTVSSLDELNLLKALHNKGVYLGSHVKTLPFATKKEMENHVIMCTEFALEVISTEPNLQGVGIAIGKAYGIAAANPANAASYSSSTHVSSTTDDEEVDYAFSCWF